MSKSIGNKCHLLSNDRRVSLVWITQDDVAEMADIASRVQSFAGPVRKSTIVKALATTGSFGLAAKFADTLEISGFALYQLAESFIRLPILMVDPRYHREKIGSFILSQMINLARQPNKRRELRVRVAEENLPGLMFLKSHGFQATDTIRGAYISNDLEERDVYQMTWAAKVLSV